jgi:hypothetical protein
VFARKPEGRLRIRKGGTKLFHRTLKDSNREGEKEGQKHKKQGRDKWDLRKLQVLKVQMDQVCTGE